MEDRSYICASQGRGLAVQVKSSPAKPKPLQPLAMGCVFDGHSGDYVAEMLKEKFAVRAHTYILCILYTIYTIY